jgi:uncharacterized protein YuzE
MRLRHDFRRDLLRFELHDGAGALRETGATIDIGEGGRLIGVEIEGVASHPGSEPFYLTIGGGSGGVHARSAEVRVTIETDHSGALLAVEVPRHGHGYEITWPSGNR